MACFSLPTSLDTGDRRHCDLVVVVVSVVVVVGVVVVVVVVVGLLLLAYQLGHR